MKSGGYVIGPLIFKSYIKTKEVFLDIEILHRFKISMEKSLKVSAVRGL